MPEDIDFSTKSILVKNTKNGHERYVFFGHMSANLKRWMQHRDRYSDSPYLLPPSQGTQLSVTNFGATDRRKGRHAWLEIHPHLLRINFAKYYLIEGNGDFATLSRILGHASVETTMKSYLDFTDREIGMKYQKHSPP